MTRTALLRHLAASYVRDRKTCGELRSRLVGMAHERSRITDGVPTPDHGARLAEVDRVRATLERSSRAADERLRATEAVVAAVVREAALQAMTAAGPSVAPTTAPTTPPVATERPAAPRPPAPVRSSVRRDPMRGGWSQPPD